MDQTEVIRAQQTLTLYTGALWEIGKNPCRKLFFSMNLEEKYKRIKFQLSRVRPGSYFSCRSRMSQSLAAIPLQKNMLQIEKYIAFVYKWIAA